jgi:hypothetical protein
MGKAAEHNRTEFGRKTRNCCIYEIEAIKRYRNKNLIA